MSEIWLLEGKIEHLSLTTKIGNQTIEKIKKTYTIIFVSELAFRHIFWIEKIRLYAQVTEEKLTGPPHEEHMLKVKLGHNNQGNI